MGLLYGDSKSFVHPQLHRPSEVWHSAVRTWSLHTTIAFDTRRDLQLSVSLCAEGWFVATLADDTIQYL